MARIRKGDLVQVIAGENKGAIAKVLTVLLDKDKVIVEGVNKVFKHVKPSQRNPKGGRLSKEMPIHVSNVLLYNSERGKGVRTSVATNSKGDKVLVDSKTKTELRVLRPAKDSKK